MAKPPKVAPVLTLPKSPFTDPLAATEQAQADLTTGAEVTAAWDNLRAALGQTVPANVNRARAAARRFSQAVS